MYYSDVAFSVNAAGNPIVYLVRADAAGAFAVRLDDPAGAGQAAISAAANRSRIVAAPAPAAPVGGRPAAGARRSPPARKLAICASRPDIAFVRIATRAGGDFGVFRTRTARNAPMSGAGVGTSRRRTSTGATSARGPTTSRSPSTRAARTTSPPGWSTSTSRETRTRPLRTCAWLRAMAWDLYQFDRAHHGDHHVAAFAPQPGAAAGTPPGTLGRERRRHLREHRLEHGRRLRGRTPQAARRRAPADRQRRPHAAAAGRRRQRRPVAGAPISWRKRSHGIIAGADVRPDAEPARARRSTAAGSRTTACA